MLCAKPSDHNNTVIGPHHKSLIESEQETDICYIASPTRIQASHAGFGLYAASWLVINEA